MPLRPDRAGVHLVLRLNQRHHNVLASLKDLPDVRRPSPPLRKIACVNDKVRCIFLAVLSGDDFMTGNKKKDIPSRQFGLPLHQFDRVTRPGTFCPTAQVGVDWV